MGLFRKKAGRTVEGWRAEFPVPPAAEPLLSLGVALIERDAKENGSFILADPRAGKGTKYLYPMWDIVGQVSLSGVVGDLIQRSRQPTVDTTGVDRARAKVAAAFDAALAGDPLPGMDLSADRIAQVTDMGGLHLEYAAYLARLEVGMPWGTTEHAIELLLSLRAEVAERFATWSDYAISVAMGQRIVDVPFGHPDMEPVFVRVARDPASAYRRFPLHD